MQYLSAIEKGLESGVLSSVEVVKKGNATLSFVFTFEDGTTQQTNEIVINQGESINGAYIQNGHLKLTLTNSEVLDAGNIKPVTRFELTNEGHLIVYYGDGTSQDLGVLLSGNVNIDGNITANSIIEKMTGYSLAVKDASFTNAFIGVVKNGNKLTIALAGTFTPSQEILTAGIIRLARINIPASIYNKLVPISPPYILTANQTLLFTSQSDFYPVAWKAENNYSNAVNINLVTLTNQNLQVGVNYAMRIEMTFLLSDNLVSE